MNVTNGKLRRFDLQEALTGKAVMLSNGEKAFVRHHETELPIGENARLLGYGAGGVYRSWCENGDYLESGRTSGYDIIGMYPETRAINGFEVPVPETQAPGEGATYYFPILHAADPYGTEWWNRNEGWHKRYLKRGLVFLNKEDAIATSKAMMGIDPNSEEEL